MASIKTVLAIREKIEKVFKDTDGFIGVESGKIDSMNIIRLHVSSLDSKLAKKFLKKQKLIIFGGYYDCELYLFDKIPVSLVVGGEFKS